MESDERTPAEIIHARRKLCFKMAEFIQDTCEDMDNLDLLWKSVDMALPIDRFEADAYMADASDTPMIENRGPSMIAALREAVHATDDMSIRTIMEAATIKCKDCDRWKRFASYCRSCALSGEHDPMEFIEFAAHEELHAMPAPR